MRRVSHLTISVVVLALILWGAYQGSLAWLHWREAAAPSTVQLLYTHDGRQIPLIQPTVVPVVAGAAADLPNTGGARPRSAFVLPPERVLIPAIDLDWPVVLATAEHLPRFRGVGWLLGSAFPGAPGNLVLLGHRGGTAGTFMRLPELRIGDEIQVVTEQMTYHYQVRDFFDTNPANVEVLAPTSSPVVTLVTCTGDWDPVAQTNLLRYIVVADLVSADPTPVP